MIYPVGDLEDLTDSELIIPAFPSKMKEDPELPYLLFEKLNLRRIVAQRFPKKFAERPIWVVPALDREENMNDYLYKVYLENFVFLHPEHLVFIEDVENRASLEESIAKSETLAYE